ncbi:hypothetical protein [Mangrovibacter phragmitis]|uniref:hypothetical protein n=1 Tax=Mangrovibacter phragmitis TaxID=1691903 RepID=UPI00336A46D6
MTALIALFTGAKSFLLVTLGGIIAVGLAYFSGRKSGSVQTKAADDVEAAKEETQQAQQVVKTQAEISKVANDVKTENASVSDAAARDRMRKSKYNSDD